jgi:hypothetical protein
MSRPNFYVLLDLSIDPPEKDPKKIGAAIKKKQAEWSRLRNHPSKGIQAKQYIGMLAKIKEVMADETLREKEIQEAKKMRAQQQKERFSAAERHLGIYLSKGNITGKEVARISKLHGIKEEQVRNYAQKRIPVIRIEQAARSISGRKKVTDKQIEKLANKLNIEPAVFREHLNKHKEKCYADIDRYFTARLGRGYITDREIRQLADLFGLQEEDVHRRTRLPIRKGGRGKVEKPKLLEGTIGKLIDDNLQIVGAKSLYDFLGVPKNAKLEEVQKRAKEKETEVRTIRKKDAATTAASVLSGHCIAMFKNQETRDTYDSALARKQLENFKKTIDVAVIDGKIRKTYFDQLIRLAVQETLDPGEAEAFIRDYCRENKWNLEVRKRKKKAGGKKTAVAAGIVLALFLAGFGVYTFYTGKAEKEYKQVMADVSAQDSLGQKAAVLSEYVNSGGEDNKYKKNARRRLKEIKQEMVARDFTAAAEKAGSLAKEGKLEGAVFSYKGFVDSHPNDPKAKEALEEINRLSQMIERRDFAKVQAAADMDYNDRLRIYNAFIDKHPQSEHVAEIREIIAGMFDERVDTLKKTLAECEKARDWETCGQLAADFAKKFEHNEKVNEIRELKKKYDNRKLFAADMARMRKRAEAMGTDFTAAKKVFMDYVIANPEAPSYIKKEISEEMEVLDKKIAEQKRKREEWNQLRAYATDPDNNIESRISRVSKYIRANQGGTYEKDAEDLLVQLQGAKKEMADRARMAAEKREWNQIIAMIKADRGSLGEQIRRLDAFLNKSPSAQYREPAEKIRTKLAAKKQAQDARLRAEQAERARIEAAKSAVRRLLPQSGGRFTETRDGVIQDRTTGLFWSMLDTQDHYNRCLNYEEAKRYVNGLNAGGYSDWRLPTAVELTRIYKKRPFFPVRTQKWYWSADSVWRGWNHEVYVVTNRHETARENMQVEVGKCGAARAVRP